MKANKLQDMTVQELNNKLAELKGELFNLRFQLATGQLDNPMRVKFVRKDIARIQTILREKELKQVNA
ncbi:MULTISPECIES: 50S ribosomal protein L29 [Geosporobacter]|uniref:Large ribosomal subunit protein uL29 n=2 Tax=Geosporobacter TaxID=390805 RepID=A0A1D8GJT4_9FIRM|nr:MULTISPECIES: 50S ribosomal protein L29 [Geosporobacter]AOT71176.1 50S ribosomal protein L29 [Geosporobacter ferrireducens]MTI57988.1 50S ribosomal protein L29 [Geosporobacter ferrireducens]SHJ95378.1 large subunit ribosomal protein L29 [Geosporobacter subterraneus DSM 17957]